MIIVFYNYHNYKHANKFLLKIFYLKYDSYHQNVREKNNLKLSEFRLFIRPAIASKRI
jgi:hypothetical protein